MFPSFLLMRGLVPDKHLPLLPHRKQKRGAQQGLLQPARRPGQCKDPRLHGRRYQTQWFMCSLIKPNSMQCRWCSRTTFPSTLYAAELGEHRAIPAPHPAPWLQAAQPMSSCHQGLVRSLLCRHIAASHPIPSPALQLHSNVGLRAVEGLQIFVVSLIFHKQTQHSTWQHWLTASCYLMSMFLTPGCWYRDICGGSIHIPSLSLSSRQRFQHPALLFLRQAPMPLPGCMTR